MPQQGFLQSYLRPDRIVDSVPLRQERYTLAIPESDEPASMSEKIYEPSFSESPSDLEAYADLVAIVRQLRRDCPWDRKQTHESVKHLLIEETYEVVEAIDNKNFDELKVELGDVFLHVLFNAAIAEGDGRFRLRDVIDSLTDKLVRRHPHVFGDVAVSGVGEVLSNWEDIKSKEGGGKRKSVLQGVPAELPALLRAFRIQDKVAGVGFDFPDGEAAFSKVTEEIEEFRSAAGSDGSQEEKEEEFGDLLFALVNFARLNGINSEDALRVTNQKFIRRFVHVEQRLSESGSSPKEASLTEMDQHWDEAKTLGL